MATNLRKQAEQQLEAATLTNNAVEQQQKASALNAKASSATAGNPIDGVLKTIEKQLSDAKDALTGTAATTTPPDSNEAKEENKEVVVTSVKDKKPKETTTPPSTESTTEPATTTTV